MIKNNLSFCKRSLLRQYILTDKASRVFDENTEQVFVKIKKCFGKFCIDLFASRLDTKNAIYSSWKPYPSASIVDTFSTNWSNFNCYAFPPFSVIMKSLVKIKMDIATGFLICPMWITQPWFPKLIHYE